ncbi:MAG TPA: hypothetical protein PK706_04360 [Xanthobacteraceae bacterium]|nr:hypothetical protein [Xanthobacteraceae bacterium]
MTTIPQPPGLAEPSELATDTAPLDEALDEALEATFPASDPVALSITRPVESGR